MSVHHTDSYYEELYTKHKRLIDRVDNTTIAVYYYIDKKRRSRAVIDCENPIYIDEATHTHKFRLGAVI